MNLDRRVLAALGIAALLLAGCGREGNLSANRVKDGAIITDGKVTTKVPRIQVASASRLESFDRCGDVTKSLRTQALKYVSPYGLPGAMGFGGAIADAVGGAPVRSSAQAESGDAAPAPAPLSAGKDYSQTNVQEENVDEPDSVETDGRRVFVAAQGAIHAAEVSDGSTRLIGKLNLTSHGDQLLLAGDRLMVIGQEFVDYPVAPGRPGAEIALYPAASEKTLVRVIDVSNPAEMRISSELHLEGGYISARAIDGIARIVLRRGQPDIVFASPQSGEKPALDKALEHNKDAVRDAPVEKWIPRFELESSEGKTGGALSTCSSTYHPATFSGFGTVTVVTVDPKDPKPRDGSTVVGGGEIVYASRDSLYVTSQYWGDPRPLAGPDVRVIEPGQTNIHKFDIRGDAANYVASGTVKGTLLNQFAMSDHDGHLRVASTTDPQIFGPMVPEGGAGSSESAVTVFAQRGPALIEVGRVGGLGRTERIYSVRFMGPVGYVVTFRQVDPLYTIDLSDPAAPKVAGELKIPGFSSYLHPVAEGRVLGVGQEVEEVSGDAIARTSGTKLSLFDVSDIGNPREVDSFVVRDGHSQAEYDHHSFLWWGPKKMAVLPVERYDPEKGTQGFSGAFAFRVDGGVDEIGRLEHPITDQGAEAYRAPISRSLVVDGSLVTVSETGLQLNNIDSFERLEWVEFPVLPQQSGGTEPTRID